MTSKDQYTHENSIVIVQIYIFNTYMIYNIKLSGTYYKDSSSVLFLNK